MWSCTTYFHFFLSLVAICLFILYCSSPTIIPHLLNFTSSIIFSPTYTSFDNLQLISPDLSLSLLPTFPSCSHMQLPSQTFLPYHSSCIIKYLTQIHISCFSIPLHWLCNIIFPYMVMLKSHVPGTRLADEAWRTMAGVIRDSIQRERDTANVTTISTY